MLNFAWGLLVGFDSFRLGLADGEADLIESAVNDNTGAGAWRRRKERAGDLRLTQVRQNAKKPSRGINPARPHDQSVPEYSPVMMLRVKASPFAPKREMITVSQIRNGEGYLSRHLSANDYYSEGERVQGYWLGNSAEKLGLKGLVAEPEFESLRANRHPFTGEKLTLRQHKVAFHDIVVSAPKSFSIAAIVGQDERLVDAFHESSRRIFVELEKHAAVRVRAREMADYGPPFLRGW